MSPQAFAAEACSRATEWGFELAEFAERPLRALGAAGDPETLYAAFPLFFFILPI